MYVRSCFVVTNKRFRVCCLGNLQVSRWQLGVFCSFFNKYYSKQYSWHNTCVRGRLWMAVCIVPIPKHNVVGGSAVVILELEWTDWTLHFNCVLQHDLGRTHITLTHRKNPDWDIFKLCQKAWYHLKIITYSTLNMILKPMKAWILNPKYFSITLNSHDQISNNQILIGHCVFIKDTTARSWVRKCFFGLEIIRPGVSLINYCFGSIIKEKSPKCCTAKKIFNGSVPFINHGPPGNVHAWISLRKDEGKFFWQKYCL